MRINKKTREASRVFFYVILHPDCDQPDGGGDQQDAYSHNTGNSSGVHTFICKQLHFSADSIIHGVVHTSTGDQRENGDNQVGYGRIFPDSCHGL